MTKKILIIKLGAIGDVVRTTPLLRVLDGEVFWVTKAESVGLLPHDHVKGGVYDIDRDCRDILRQEFDLVLCLDDEREPAMLASSVRKRELVGTYLDKTGRVTYTDSASRWFDMGLLSRRGKDVADELKKANTQTYQSILFDMLGKKFAGEEYLINLPSGVESDCGLVGMERRAGDRWPSKKWHGYPELAERLRADGWRVSDLMQRDSLLEYMRDIAQKCLIVAGDTLGLHLALALRVKTVAIFTCTSPLEIHGYGRMTKIVSPRLHEAFYAREYHRDVVEAVRVDAVHQAVCTMIGSCPRRFRGRVSWRRRSAG